MGRSVSTASGSIRNVFLDVSEYDSETWDDFVDDLRMVIREKYPSFDDADKWIDREDHVILENRHARIALAEYCGLASVGLVPREDESGYGSVNPQLAAAWCAQIAEKWHAHICKRYPETAYYRRGTFSNGESVYGKVAI